MAAPRARLEVSQTRVSDSLSRAIFHLMALVKPRKHESTKARNHETTKPRKTFVACVSCFRVFVFSWLIVMTAQASSQGTQVRVESPEGGEVNPFDTPADIKAIVFLFTSTDCPISNRYAPEVLRLATKFAPRGVLFRLVYPDPADKRSAILDHMTAFAYAGATPALRDPNHALVKFTGVTVTPEAAVYAGGRIVYHGRIDDRYVDLGLERPAATVHDLDEALIAVLAGRPVKHPVTQAVGCYIADFK
jgi:hypothetical protein